MRAAVVCETKPCRLGNLFTEPGQRSGKALGRSSGHADAMLCGATEAALNAVGIAGFARMRALATAFNDNPAAASRGYEELVPVFSAQLACPLRDDAHSSFVQRLPVDFGYHEVLSAPSGIPRREVSAQLP